MVGTFRPRHSCTRMPSGLMRKVLRSMPLTFFAVHDLVLTTPNMWHIFFGVGNEPEGQLQLSLKSSCDFMLSRDTPNTTAPAFSKSLNLSRNCMASVQPGVLSLGRSTESGSALVRYIGNLDSAGRIGFKFGKGFVDNDRHGTSIHRY